MVAVQPGALGIDSLDEGDSILNLNRFNKLLDEVNPNLLDADFGVDEFGEIEQEFAGISRGGGSDPAFQKFQKAQFDVFESGAQNQRNLLEDQLLRRGLSGSSVGFGERGKIESGLSQQKNLLSSQLGLQQLGRGDAARLNRIGALQARGGAVEQGLEAKTAALENLLTEPSLLIAELAAKNAGEGSDDDGDDGIFGNLPNFLNGGGGNGGVSLPGILEGIF